MTRTEVVEFYTQVALVCGVHGLAALVTDRYLTRGLPELHDPEWVTCMECGLQWEVPLNGAGRWGHAGGGEFCAECREQHRYAVAKLKREWPALVREAA